MTTTKQNPNNKVILIDAWNTFVTEEGINLNIQSILNKIECKKIIVTNANSMEQIKFGIVNMPYEVFSLDHSPNKTNANYFKILVSQYDIKIDSILYFDHNLENVTAAQSVGIKSFFYDQVNPNYNELNLFLTN